MSSGTKEIHARLFDQWASISKLVVDKKRDGDAVSKTLQGIVEPVLAMKVVTLQSVEDELALARGSDRAQFEWLEDHIVSLFNGDREACIQCDGIQGKLVRFSESQILSALISKYADLRLVAMEASRIKTEGRKCDHFMITPAGCINFECDCFRVGDLLEAVKRAVLLPLVKRDMVENLQVGVPGCQDMYGLPILLICNPPNTLEHVIDIAKSATIKGRVITDKKELEQAIRLACEPDDEPAHEFERDRLRDLDNGYLVCAIVGK